MSAKVSYFAFILYANKVEPVYVYLLSGKLDDKPQ